MIVDAFENANKTVAVSCVRSTDPLSIIPYIIYYVNEYAHVYFATRERKTAANIIY